MQICVVIFPERRVVHHMKMVSTNGVLPSWWLADLLDTLNVNVPMRMNPDHLLDVIVTDPELQVRRE